MHADNSLFSIYYLHEIAGTIYLPGEESGKLNFKSTHKQYRGVHVYFDLIYAIIKEY